MAPGCRVDEIRGLRVAVVLADGLHSRGGIGRTMLYLGRAMRQLAPEITLVVEPARLGRRRLLKELTTPFLLLRFALHCIGGRVDVAHINVAPRGSTLRKMAFARLACAAGVPVILHLHG